MSCISTAAEAVCHEIDLVKDKIIAIGNDIFDHPETGFKETRTAAVVADFFRDLGLEVKTGLAVTGVKATLKGAKPGPNVAIIGELDSVVSLTHPRADINTGAAHACAHHAQLAALFGAAAGLVNSNAAQHLCGSITFFAVPAEELLEVGFRRRLVSDNVIGLIAGKPELVRLGEFDDIDIAMMAHAMSETPDLRFNIGTTSLGFTTKDVKFIGKAAHAGAVPFEGVNALNAAMMAMMGMHVNRETFRDSDKVRVHPIIVSGGEIVNTVPDDVRMELMVRAANIPALQDACQKVDRSIEGACLTVGAQCEINSLPGYLPLMESSELNAVFERCATQLFGADAITHEDLAFGSTDMGDISQLIPSVHIMHGGIRGNLHCDDVEVSDTNAAYIAPAKALAVTALELLVNGAEEGKSVIDSFTPGLTKEEYLKLVTP